MRFRGFTKYLWLSGAGLIAVACQVRELPSSGGTAKPTGPEAVATPTAASPALPGVRTGLVTLVDVWAPWDAPSRAGQVDLDRLARAYPSGELRVVGLAIADDSSPDAWPAVSYERILVQREQLAALGPIRALPTRLLIDRHGTIRHVYPGPQLPPGYEEDLKALLKEHL